MKQFSFSDMNRVSGEILEAALIEPVLLKKRGRDKLIILTAERYNQLIGKSGIAPYRVGESPDDVHEELMHGLDAILHSKDDND